MKPTDLIRGFSVGVRRVDAAHGVALSHGMYAVGFGGVVQVSEFFGLSP